MTSASKEMERARFRAADEQLSVVVVDGEEPAGRALELALRRHGFRSAFFTHLHAALASTSSVDVVVTDVVASGLSGLDLLRAIRERLGAVEVVMTSGPATVPAAVAAVEGGAYDFVRRPFEDVEQVLRVVRRAGERRRLLDRNHTLEAQVSERQHHVGLMGRSPRVEELRRRIATVGRGQQTVLIRGESGSDMEQVARALHATSDRAAGPFVAVSCSALRDSQLETELFGQTVAGAASARRGSLEQAAGGTLFLDEIGDVSPALQVRLLRMLELVGAGRLDVRLIAATSVDLENAVNAGRFRRDLRDRLGGVALQVPALRERPEDIPLLAQHFLGRFAAQARRAVHRMSPGFVESLLAHGFPGDVRELEYLVERAVVLAQGDELTPAELPAELRPGAGPAETVPLAELPYAEARRLMLRNFERRYFSTLLRRFGGNLTAAARAAGMDRSNFRRSLKASGLRSPGSPGDDPAREAAG